MTPLLQVRNLRIGFDGKEVVHGVDLDIAAGEKLALVGESGSGKTITALSLLRLVPNAELAGVASLFGPERTAGGRDLLSISERELRGVRGREIAMIFQEPMTALNPLYPVGDQIAEVLELHEAMGKREAQAAAVQLLADTGVPEPARRARSFPHQLSGGQRQRAMIAMALALEPEVLIADEPTTALDVTTQAQILSLIHDLQRRRGTAVLFITHDFGVVAEIADRVAVMQRGELVESGRAEEVLRHPRHPYTRALIAAVPPLAPAAARAPGAPEKPAILTTDGLSKTYRKRGWFGQPGRVTHALDGVSLTLREGGTLGIVGESGSGKSTLARTLLGLLPPDAGAITLAGEPLAFKGAAARRAHARRVQMVFQDPYGSLNPRQRVGEIVARGPIVHGAPRREAWAQARELFELVGLSPDAINRYPHEFSGGQRQRVGLARALAMRPRVLIADEPVSALDVSVQAQVLALLARLREQLGLSILFITHDLRVAAQVCDHVAVMKDGKVVEAGPCAEVFGQPSHSYTQALLAAVPGRGWDPAGAAARRAA